MNAGNRLWDLTTSAFSALPNGDVHFILFDDDLGQLSADGNFSNSSETVLTANVGLSEHTFNSTNFSAAGNEFTNTVEIRMPYYVSGRSFGSYAIVDTEALTADNAVILFWNLPSPLYVPSYDSIVIESGALKFNLI